MCAWAWVEINTVWLYCHAWVSNHIFDTMRSWLCFIYIIQKHSVCYCVFRRAYWNGINHFINCGFTTLHTDIWLWALNFHRYCNTSMHRSLFRCRPISYWPSIKTCNMLFDWKHASVYTIRDGIKVVNPLHVKFFRGNIDLYLHFMSFLQIDMTQVVEILPQVRQWHYHFV